MTLGDARSVFLETYSSLHSFTSSADEWELAMSAEPFVHLGAGVKEHPAMRCYERQQQGMNGAGMAKAWIVGMVGGVTITVVGMRALQIT